MRSFRRRLAVSVFVLSVAAVCAFAGSSLLPNSEVTQQPQVVLTANATASCSTNQGHCFTLGPVNQLGTGTNNLAPGDSLQRPVDISYDQTMPSNSTITLTTSVTAPPGKTANSLSDFQLGVVRCSNSWTSVGTSAHPSYTCLGTTSQVLAPQPAALTNATLKNLSSGSVKAGTVDHLLLTLSFPSTSALATSGKSSVITYNFVATGGNNGQGNG